MDDLVLEARDLPPSTFSIMFMGAGQTVTALGNGQRVVAPGGAGLFRFGVQQADLGGFLRRGPGLVAQSQGFLPAGRIAPGQTWNFQAWYRDPAASAPCLGTSNLTNGFQVAFGP